MIKPKIIIIAPGHDEFDNRVVRTVNIVENSGYDYIIYYERKRSVCDCDLECKGEVGYFNLNLQLFDLLLFSKCKLLALFPSILSSDLIYIHDSGVVGLAIARSIKKFYPDKIVIFDYHDLIEWEIYYQLKKFNFPLFFTYFTYKLLALIHLLFYRKAKCFDFIVGISSPQLDNFINKYSFDIGENDFFVVPNSRDKLTPPYLCDKDVDDNVFLWVGNVRKGRDIEGLIKNVVMFNKLTVMNTATVFFAGAADDPSICAMSDLNISLGGRFAEDLDIIKMLPKSRVIGVFMGWDDPVGTMINKIASPNKIYSYLNLGIPILCHASLKDSLQSQGFNCIIYFDSLESFVAAAELIFCDYSLHLSKVISNRDNFENWSDSLNLRYSSFLNKIF
jgi:hypothetical protein